LTADNFKDTVSSGVWFVEHFSPFCHHCRAFAPTWTELVATYEAMDDPGIQFAQVDCVVSGDLCDANEIKGYPQMNIYRNGEFQVRFKGTRDLERLVPFVEEYAQPVTPRLSHDEAEATETQASPQVPLRKLPNPTGAVQSLGPENFFQSINDGPIFIKFFAPWCGHCKKLAPVWTQLAAHMKNKLTIAEVNCETHSALCKTQDVKGFPMLTFYTGGTGPGGQKTEYTGGRKLEQLQRFAEMATAPAVSRVNVTEYEDYVKHHDVVYLFLHSPSDEQSLNELRANSHILLGSPPILTNDSPDLRSRFTLPDVPSTSPVLLAIKDHVPFAFTSAYSPSSPNLAALTDWMLTNRLPTALELSQDNFQSIMNAPHQPLVVLVATEPERKSDIEAKVRVLSMEWRRREARKTSEQDRDIVFTWMDADKWASWLKSMYGIKPANLPAVILADHTQLRYYDNDVDGNKISLSSQSLFSAVEGVFNGTIRHKYSENIFERSARYLNNYILWLEGAVIRNPWRTGLIFAGFLALVVYAARRFILDEINGYAPSPQDVQREKLRKSGGRLD